jgi:hypothetical protein
VQDLLREDFVDDATRGGVNAGISDLGPPGLELGVYVVEVAEAAKKKS